MPTLKTLKRRAKESAMFRGHKLSRFQTLHSHAAAADCLTCGASVYVNTKPLPNGIDIAGHAVALNCPANFGGSNG